MTEETKTRKKNAEQIQAIREAIDLAEKTKQEAEEARE